MTRESASNRGPSLDVPAIPPEPDAIRGVSSAGPTDDEQLRGVGGKAIQSARQGNGETLVRGRRRSIAATASRPPERRPTAEDLLASPAKQANRTTPLSPGRLITNRVVHLERFSLVIATNCQKTTCIMLRLQSNVVVMQYDTDPPDRSRLGLIRLARRWPRPLRPA
jgi:hypothetical protein